MSVAIIDALLWTTISMWAFLEEFVHISSLLFAITPFAMGRPTLLQVRASFIAARILAIPSCELLLEAM